MISQHEPGAKLDDGKIRASLVLGAFANALTAVSKVGTFGASKYTDNGWLEVPNGIERYTDAMLRHWLAEQTGEWLDSESDLLHAAHLAWNALARLELVLREQPFAPVNFDALESAIVGALPPTQPWHNTDRAINVIPPKARRERWDVPPNITYGTHVGQYPAPAEPED